MIRRIVKIECLLLLITSLITSFVIYNDYTSRPGLISNDTLMVTNRTADTIQLEWTPVRNTESYTISFKPVNSEEWKDISITGDKTSTEIEDLDEGQEYEFSLKADSAKREGVTKDTVSTSTKKRQTIEGKTKQMKLANSNIDLGLNAETEIKVESEDESVVVDENDVKLTKPGTVKLTVVAEETDEYVQDEAEIEVEVLDSVYEETSSANIHTIYKLNSSNCEVVKAVTGSGSAVVPQSFGYDKGTYMIAYGMEDSAQKIVTYTADGEKTVSNPKVKLGHPNGFAYSDLTGKGYCVKGWSGRCVTYNPEDGSYDVFTLPYGASGIAYDRDKELFYTSTRNLMVAYDKDFNVVLTTPAVSHKGYYYTQDCGGHAGIMMRCLSDKTRHGTNLIDLYDMIGGKYLGTIECDLSEVESAIVDDEGYMELLCNTTNEKDYIWKTPINIDELGVKE